MRSVEQAACFKGVAIAYIQQKPPQHLSVGIPPVLLRFPGLASWRLEKKHILLNTSKCIYVSYGKNLPSQIEKVHQTKKHPKNTLRATVPDYFQAISFRKEKNPYHFNEPSLGSSFFPPRGSDHTTLAVLAHDQNIFSPSICPVFSTKTKWKTLLLRVHRNSYKINGSVVGILTRL